MSFIGFLSWHYGKALKGIFRAWFNFVLLGLHVFSVPLLLRTLFAPWRRIEIKKSAPGFSPAAFFNNLIFNLISRGIGFSVRIFLIILGVLFSLSFFLLGLPLVLTWLFLPFISWPLYLITQKPPKTKVELLKGEARKFVFQRLGITNEEDLKKVDPKDLEEVLVWYLKNKAELNKKKKFWLKENLFRVPSIGSSLAFGYTLMLDELTEDLDFPPSFSHQLVGREKEIKQIEAVLSRSSQANVLLVGHPGVGKHTILLGFAKTIRERQVNPRLFYKRVLMVNMNLILGKSVWDAQGKAKFQEILQEAEQAGNIILVINSIDEYIFKQANINLTSAIAHVAESRGTQIIGVTTPEAYAKNIFPNEEFLKYFEVLEVKPPSREEALEILENILTKLERGKNVVTTFNALKEIVEQSDKLVTHIPFPEKAVDLLDQLINEAEANGKKTVIRVDVDQLISQRTKVPIGTIGQKEREKLKELDSILHRRIVDQNQAVSALVKAMQRARVGISEREKPMGTFLFLGPTGVGKTETAKVLAENFCGDEKRLIRFDMSQPFSFELFVRQAREHPFSVLLLDEFEKASAETIHLFLTVFDEGYIRDKEGSIVSFKNMIVICTSNAGAEFIRERVKAGLKPTEVTEYVLRQKIFSPETINRFDGVIVFEPLKKEDIKKIAELLMTKLKSRLKEKEIILEADSAVYDELVSEGYNFEFGARPMKRLIADKIESLIAQMMLDGKIQAGKKLMLIVDQKSKEFIIIQN